MTQFRLEKLGHKTTRVIRVTAAKEKEMIFSVPFLKLTNGMADWEQGSLAQNSLSFCSADEREFILTGITPEEWDEMFSEGEA